MILVIIHTTKGYFEDYLNQHIIFTYVRRAWNITHTAFLFTVNSCYSLLLVTDVALINSIPPSFSQHFYYWDFIEFVDCYGNEFMYLHNQNYIFPIMYVFPLIILTFCPSEVCVCVFVFGSFLSRTATYFLRFIFKYHTFCSHPILSGIIPHHIFYGCMLGFQYVFLNVWSD